MLAPKFAKFKAQANPMPCVAPEINMFLFLKLKIIIN